MATPIPKWGSHGSDLVSATTCLSRRMFNLYMAVGGLWRWAGFAYTEKRRVFMSQTCALLEQQKLWKPPLLEAILPGHTYLVLSTFSCTIQIASTLDYICRTFAFRINTNWTEY